MLYIVSLITPILHLNLIIVAAILEAISRKCAKVKLRLVSQFRVLKFHMADESNDLGYESSNLQDHANTSR